MKHILIIDDAPDVQIIVKNTLEPSHKTTGATTISAALQLLQENEFDLILLDVVLPDGDGFHFFTQIRNMPKTAKVPIIFLTGKNEVTDRVLAYSLGADDYIQKPIIPIELRARVGARLRSREQEAKAEQSYRKGDLLFDFARQMAFISNKSGDQHLGLTSIEFKLLLYFAQHEEHVLSREQLLAAVWSAGTHVADRVVDVYVSALRKNSPVALTQ